MHRRKQSRSDLHQEVTVRIIAELEQGRLPWVQPWDNAAASPGMPRNAATGRTYSGINILLLWSAVLERGHAVQRWLTFRQALALGGHVRRGEQGVAICFADSFVPAAEQQRACDAGEDPRQVPFLKRFTVFNVEQCEGLPAETLAAPASRDESAIVPEAEALVAASGAELRIGGDMAFYSPQLDLVQVPPQGAFRDQINWYRTVFHELGHWTGHASRLDRDQTGGHGTPDYAREELVAEMASAFLCAELGIRPTVRHADYVGAWLEVLREDVRAIFRAASQASRAADYLLAFRPSAEPEDGR